MSDIIDINVSKIVEQVEILVTENLTTVNVNTTTNDTSKVDKNNPITGATKAKITYDAKGLVTNGENLIASDIPTLPQSKITGLVSGLSDKAPKNNPTFTGSVVVPSATANNEAVNLGQLDTAISEIPTTTPTLQQVTTAGATTNVPTTFEAGISASSGDIGIIAYGGNNGISAYGGDIGIQAGGGNIGIIASGNLGIIASGNIGINASGDIGNAGIFNIPTENTSNIVEFQKNSINQASISHDGKVTANGFIKSGGTGSQFLKADGSVDSTVYPTNATVVTLSGTQTITGAKTFTSDVQIPAIPTNATSAASKSYIDNAITGITWKSAVRVATTANITLSGTQTIGGIALNVGDRVLVKNQTNQTNNGIYLVASGSWTRSLDADTGAEIETATVSVLLGTVNNNTQWTCTSANITIGVTNITFGQISGAGTYSASNGVQLTGNNFTIDSTVATLNGTQTLLNKTITAPLGIVKADIGLSNVDNTSDVNKPISTATQTSLDTKLNSANNLSDIANAKTARVNIGVDKRTIFGNVNYSALITDKEIVTSASFTAPRTVTLIDGVNAGAEIIVADEFQTVTSVNTLTIAVPTGKYLNGVLNGTEVIRAVGGWRRFLCDGNGNYFYDAGVARLSGSTFTGAVVVPNAVNLNEAVNLSQLNLKANEDGTILYHNVRWFTPTSTVSNVGATVTSVGTQFTSAMIGSKLTINGEQRIITAFTSSTVVTVVSAYSQNYSGVVVANWGVFSKLMETNSSGQTSFFTPQGIVWITQVSSFINASSLIGLGGNFQLGFFGLDLATSHGGLRFSNGTAQSNTKDAGLRRNSAGVLEVYDGVTNGVLRDLRLRNVIATTPTYANDAAADSDSTLPSGAFYKITGSRQILQKP